MTGLLQIVDKSGERTVELARTGTTIGSDRADSIPIKGENLGPALVTLNWDNRRATWVLFCPLPLAAPVVVNRRTATPGEQIPLANLDVIEVPGAFLKFRRILATPSRAGKPLTRIPLDNKVVAIGRGDPKATVDIGRVDLDSEETTISRVHALIEPDGRDYVVSDHSRRGMELNGVAFTRERLVFGDRLRISSYIFEFTGNSLRLIHPERSGSLSAQDLTVVAGGRKI
ncbi:MAG TPA: FHA domain-containing protein, partial [Chthoniobacterales bacterium]|nr:FHA domain-containing protein [Chthoniobacterales bacterium]